MIVVTTNAEEDICSSINNLSKTINEFDVLHFEREGGKQDIIHLQMVVNSLNKSFENNSNIQLYFFEDGDIALILPSIEKEKIKKSQILLDDIFLDEKDISHTSNLYNSLTNMDKLKSVFDDKLKNFKENTKNKIKSKPKKKSKIDKNYVKQLLEQRTHREGIHILIVEDEPFTLKLVENILSENTIIKATSGIEAIESYMLNAPDIVFLDINLPELDGHKVLKQIHEFDEDCYVVMLSGNTLMKDVSYSLSKGAKGFVVKPFPKDKLLSYVKLCKSLKKEKRFMNEAI